MPIAVPTATDEGLLCHCPAGPDGHPVELDGCEARLPRGRARLGCPRIRSYAAGGGSRGGLTPDPRGTCPVCGELVRLDRRDLFTTDRPDVHDLTPNVRLGFVVELRPHRHRRAVCPGGGQRPAETRYQFPRVEAMLRDYGPESLR